MVQEAIRDGDLTQGAVLVVLVPAREANLAEFRNYIVESLSMGVLVLGQGVTYSVERFPALGGIQVERREPKKKSGPPKMPKTHPQAKEKQAILERLKAYREQRPWPPAPAGPAGRGGGHHRSSPGRPDWCGQAAPPDMAGHRPGPGQGGTAGGRG